MAFAKKSDATIDIQAIDIGAVEFCILGQTPLLCHSMNSKTMQELLLPKKRRNKAELEATLKHDPLAEFQSSPYLDEDPKGPTLLQLLATSFKCAMKETALDLPGTTKSQIGRMLWVEGEKVPIWGIPQMHMTSTRMNNAARTPDVRTRAIVARWASRIRVRFVQPNLTLAAVSMLLNGSGLIQGVGDWRNGKGSGTFGQFTVVAPDDAEYLHLLKHAGRAPQVQAMQTPDFYDRDSAALYHWYQDEIERRGRTPVATKPTKGNGKNKPTTTTEAPLQ